jgi:all-trans-retinol 13,14-reductase
VKFFQVNKLLPSLAKPKVSPALSHVRPGMGGMSVYVGLNGTNAELELQGKQFWALWTKEGREDLDGMVSRYLQRPRSSAADSPIPLLFISFPSAKDPLWDSRHPGKSTCTIVTVGNFDWFAEYENKRVMHRGKEYDDFKQALGQLIWRQTLALFPHLKDRVEYFDVATPVTNNYYLAAT